ncbi:hypothetical protein [Legionella fallonii]|uniref:Uncharacterized protein n=1 Tax=Legionella fallonii LLAP-10 TaxID=1212491 RepID=A0A098G9Q1_9GAMM|nr:hypothetical protein [Legionella fallonii]CEG58725.1 protein of unknown function [Legionella fallonii LLAP-10]
MFYVNEKDFVIQKVPGGKIKKNKQQGFVISYLKEDGKLAFIDNTRKREPQSAQKEGTCWYYAAAHQRYGKFYMGTERSKEIIISNYRKKCTEMTRIHAFENWFLTQFEDYISQHLLFDLTEKEVAQMMLQQGGIKEEGAYYLTTAFIHYPQECTFRTFIEAEQAKTIIKEVKMTSGQLQYDIESELATLLAQDKITKEVLDLDSLANYYDFLMIHHIWKLQGYTQAHWHPNMGIQSLIDELRHYSCLVEIDVNNVLIGTGKPRYCWFSINDPGYQIYEVAKNDSEEDEEESDTHIIRLIGADLKHVYFIDPNDASMPHEPRTIHQIPYPFFCDILLNGRGTPVYQCSDKAALPFLIHHIQLEKTPSYSPTSIRKRKNSEPGLMSKTPYNSAVTEPPQTAEVRTSTVVFANQSDSAYSPTIFHSFKLNKTPSKEYLEDESPTKAFDMTSK